MGFTKSPIRVGQMADTECANNRIESAGRKRQGFRIRNCNPDYWLPLASQTDLGRGEVDSNGVGSAQKNRFRRIPAACCDVQHS